jgi:hypothetical protein
MTHDDKELLLQDLSARLPYGVMCNIGLKYPFQLQRIFVDRLDGILLDFYEDGDNYQVYLSEVKPYLRSMSSMTEKEKLMYEGLMIGTDNISYMLDVIDWLNAHHFDYRGLIPMDLAIEVTKENNPYKE